MSFFLLAVFLLVASARLAPLRVPAPDRAISNQYIVVFKTDIVAAAYDNQMRAAHEGLRVLHTFEHAIKGFAAELNEQELLSLRTNPFVDYIEGDEVVSVAKQTCTAQKGDSWGLTRVSQQKLNLNGKYSASDKQGSGVVAYIVDTGVLITHNDFKSGRATFGFKAQNEWSNTDKNGHGTHVASTVGGTVFGLAKNVEIVAVKVLGDNGSGSWAGVIAGMDYVIAQHKAKGKPSVANLSLGGGKNQAVNAAVDAAVLAGVVVAVAAGNENNNACNVSPASAKEPITTGSTDNKDARSYFSNYGECTDVFAPGSAIKGAWSTSDSATNTISGTSMASPHVCGVAALLLGEKPSLTPNEVKAAIKSSAQVDKIELGCGSNSVCKSSPNLLLNNGCQN